MDNDKISSLIFDQLENEAIEKQMSSSSYYFDWLVSFTNDIDGFSNHDWEFKKEKKYQENIENISRLQNFYNVIHNFAVVNNMNKHENKFGNYYYVRYNTICFEIGKIKGHGYTYYCEKTTPPNNKDVINFNDIIKQNNVTINCEDDRLMESFECIVKTMHDDGYQKEELQGRIDNIYAKSLSRKK